jgi:hypothetical protein
MRNPKRHATLHLEDIEMTLQATQSKPKRSSPAMDLIATWNAKQPARLNGCERRERQNSILARGFQAHYFASNLVSDSKISDSKLNLNLSDFNLKMLE